MIWFLLSLIIFALPLAICGSAISRLAWRPLLTFGVVALLLAFLLTLIGIWSINYWLLYLGGSLQFGAFSCLLVGGWRTLRSRKRHDFPPF